jgi:hypothetical protein
MAAIEYSDPTHTRRQNALADIQFASIVDDDLTPSEDESADERALQLEHVQSALGISIGQEQTRLTSPKTPAAEKAAALDQTDGGLLFEGFQDHIDATPEQAPTPHLSASSGSGSESEEVIVAPQQQVKPDYASRQEPLARLPSPWRAGPKTFQETWRASDHRAILRNTLQSGSRRRANSGGSMGGTVRKYMPFSLPSLPKTKDLHFSLPSFSAFSLDGQAAPHTSDRRRRGTYTPTSCGIPQRDSKVQHKQSASQDTISPPVHSSTAPIAQREFGTDSETLIAPPAARPSAERPTPRLRRSNSEGSLLVYRARSFASSLGDDSRFESVQEQVNSRLKAIRDSWQDANFKFPSPNLPNFNFTYRDDLFKNRNGNVPSRSREQESGTTHRVSLSPRDAPSSAPLRSKAKRPGLATMAESETHPFFAQALQGLEGDLVVLGGYRGSILRSAEPPHRQFWVPIKVGLNLRKVDLEVPFEADADEHMEETIIPSGMLKHIGPVDISKRLFKRLRACDNAKDGTLRVHDYGYDWRLSPHFLSRRMIEYLESLPCNQPSVPKEKRGAIVVAHSLGGLITRHVINKRPDLVAGVVYAGVPQVSGESTNCMRDGD